MQKPDDLSSVEEFSRWIRHALHNLYDFAELRRSPLVDLLTTDSTPGPAALQNVIISAIDAMRPTSGINPQANAARSYRVLYHRYVEQFSQAEVADDLGIGERQLRRQEATAIESLAGILADKFNLKFNSTVIPSDEPTSTGDENGTAILPTDSELEWLQHSFKVELAQINDLVQTAFKTIESMARTWQVDVQWQAPDDLPGVLLHLEPTRQALVIVLTEALRAVPGGVVLLEVNVQPKAIGLSVVGKNLQSQASASTSKETPGLELARKLLELSGGHFALISGGQPGFQAEVFLPISEQAAILFIDDNTDTLLLFQRYLAGTRYIFLGARNQEQAFELIQQTLPRVIITDVMMPGTDGWQLLGRLRNHPRTQGIPIIVCSILPQKELAYSLGAKAFLQKPVKREVLLQILDEMVNARSH